MAIPSSGYSTADFQNPASSLTDFVAVVDLADMPADFWTAVDTSDGTKGRVAKDDGTTELPSHWVDFDDVAETGFVYFKYSGTLSTTGTQTVRVYPPQSGNSSYAVTNTNGRNAVWDDYGFMLLLNEDPGGTAPQFTDVTGNGFNGTAVNMGSGNQVTGAIGNAVSFNGTDEEITLASTYGSPTASWTSIAWVYESGSPFTELGDSAGDNRIVFNPTNDRTFMEKAGNINFLDYGITLNQNQWYRHNDTHLSNGDINGYLSKTASTSNSETAATNSLSVDRIGYNGVNGFGQGRAQLVGVAEIEYSKDRHDLEYDNQSDPTTFWGTWTWNSAGTSISVSDSVGVSDSVNQLSNDFTQSDSVSLADTIAEVLNNFTVADSVSVADSNDFDISFIIADNISVTDTLNSLLNEFTLSDSISANDSVFVSQGVTNINVSDSISISDSIASLDVIFTVQDAVSLLDSVSSIGAQVVVVDTVSFTESVALTFKEIDLSDAISITESVTRGTIGDATKMAITVEELYNVLLTVSNQYNIDLGTYNLYNISLTTSQNIEGMSNVVGETITLKATFTNDSDVATTPGEPVEVSVKQPDGTLDIDSVTVSEGSTGVYEYEYTTSQAGQHYYKFASNDGAMDQGTFFVKKDEVG